MKTPQNGFSLITAIFLMVVVAAVGTFMVTIGSTQQQTSTLSVLTSRTGYAAESGMEWAIASVLQPPNVCFTSPTTFTLTGGAFNGYTVTSTCGTTSFTEGADTYNVFNLTTTASIGSIGSADYIRRSVQSSVTTAP